MKYVAFFLFGLLIVAAFAPASVAQIRLNEILADPGVDWDGDGVVDTKLDEWVEIMNTGGEAVDLAKYRISDAAAETEFRFALSGTLGPGEVRVYYGSEVVAWQAANGVSQLGLSLNNAGDTVFLYQVNGPDILVEDTRVYAAAEVLDDRSNGRLPQGTGGWVIFDGLNPYKGAQPPIPTGCSPSPGKEPDCPTTPTHSSTWGKIKSLYRG
jgi:hypothetical protein